MSTKFMFRAIWPMTDETMPFPELVKEATVDLPNVIARAHARLTAHGKWSMAPSCNVPGSGRVTEHVLIFEAPAVEVLRDYRKAVA